jgi:hypothetical protein
MTTIIENVSFTKLVGGVAIIGGTFIRNASGHKKSPEAAGLRAVGDLLNRRRLRRDTSSGPSTPGAKVKPIRTEKGASHPLIIAGSETFARAKQETFDAMLRHIIGTSKWEGKLIG